MLKEKARTNAGRFSRTDFRKFKREKEKKLNILNSYS